MFYIFLHILQTSSLSVADKAFIMFYIMLCFSGIVIALVFLVFAGIKIRKLKRLITKYGVKD